MASRTARIISIGTVIIIALVLAGIAYGRRADDGSILGKQTGQPAINTQTTAEQVKENDGGDTVVEPDINTQEFKLTAASVSCTNTNINGVESRSCSGNIRVTPRAQADMEPGLYKINEQTKLLHNGAEEDLNGLQRLAQENAFVRLTLAAGSDAMLSEVRY